VSTHASLPPMAVLAAFGLPTLTRATIKAIDWFALLFFTIFGGIHARANVPALVGGYITAAYWFTSSTSFANPIMLLARSMTNTPSGIIPAATPSFLAAEVVGCVLAAVLAGWLFRKDA
jgi:hypothetical protein